MLVEVKYKNTLVLKVILKIHDYICNKLFESAVSLRDIDRFRQLYVWFSNNLPKLFCIEVDKYLGKYNDIEERSFIMAAYFTYILRFD